ncbi:MAG: M1 family metallopeptidase [Roseiflexaceae bacterium]|nr:M1 family metallopeptidase [Roseiflexaceae bacterium]
MTRIIIGLTLVLMLCGWAPAQQSAANADQAAALLPEFRSDLDRASEWNRYTITATIEPTRPTISGRLVLEYTNRDTVALDRLYFRLFPNLADFAGRLDISAVMIGGQNRKIVYEQKRYLLRVDLPSQLRPGEKTVVALDFQTSVPVNAGRKFYGAFNLQNSVFALASAYPLVAMVRSGAWDIAAPDTRGDLVNSETALYDVTLIAPADWTLITTGSAVDGRLDAGNQTARFVSGPQRDFMIVAARLKAASADVAGTKVNAYYLPGNEAGGQAALRAAVNAIQVYNTQFGRYPLAEFDLVPVDAGTFLGVEYPGITLIEQRLYRKPGQLEIVIAHEVAHQWWYSLVGNNVQNEAWMDEALASYSQVIYAEAITGREAANAELEQFRKSYRGVRAAKRDTVVKQPNQKIRNYYPIVYSKGALFFQALRNQIGDDAFGRFLKSYYADHRYGFVNGADLLGTAEQACSCQLDQLYRDWIETAAPVAIP